MSLDAAGVLPHCLNCLSHNVQVTGPMTLRGRDPIKCDDCGQKTEPRRQEIRGSILQEDGGLKFNCNWAHGEIECKPGHPEEPKSEPVWNTDALSQMRAYYQKLERD